MGRRGSLNVKVKFKIVEPVFECVAWVFTGRAYGDIVKHAEKTYSYRIDECPENGFNACVFPVLNRFAYVWFTEVPNEKTDDFVSLVYHEAGHVAFHMLNRLGAEKTVLEGHDEEVLLYLQTFYAKNILDGLYKPKKKRLLKKAER